MMEVYPYRVISTLPDGGVHVMGPSARMIEVLQEGGGLYLIAHAPHFDCHRYGLRDHMVDHVGVDAALRNEIKRTGMIPLWLAKEWEVAKYVRDPCWGRGRADREQMAHRWVEAKHLGGYDENEAIMLIWEYSKCAGAINALASAPEIVHADALDWRHRAVWRRSHNGGAIWIDEEAFVRIDEERTWAAHEAGQAWASS